jgi:hypothetical protein
METFWCWSNHRSLYNGAAALAENCGTFKDYARPRKGMMRPDLCLSSHRVWVLADFKLDEDGDGTKLRS